MNYPHCPSCGTPFVRAIHDEGTLERILTRFKIFSFRCQLCTNHFHSFWPSESGVTQASDRRQYNRLPVSFRANYFAEDTVRIDDRVTDISMGGCTLETTSTLPRGTFLELFIKPVSDEEAIRIETAVVCSLRPESMGIRFLEILSHDKNRLSQVILSLLVGQGGNANLFPS